MAGTGGGNGEPEFQVAPMIDVLLTILIFFMTITSAQVLKVDKSIHLPTSVNAQKKDNSRAEAIVNVRWNGRTAQFVLDDVAYSASSELAQPLKTAMKNGLAKISESQNPSFRVVIRGDREAPARYIAQVMNVAGESGISDISFSATNKD
jgi:biopolymer transport protein ExbD